MIQVTVVILVEVEITRNSLPPLQACLPLIDDLSNPAMRTRHWKQLVRVTGGVFQIDNDTLKRMTLGELLSLGLQRENYFYYNLFCKLMYIKWYLIQHKVLLKYI